MRLGINRMKGIDVGPTAGSGALFTIGYDSFGRRSTLTRGGGDTVSYAYDTVSRLQTLTHSFIGGTGNMALGIGYSPASQMISRSMSNDAYSYRGDVNVDRAYARNGLNQYTSAGPASFTYDPNGNLTGDGSVNYGFDIENRLIGASGAKTASLRYDPNGRLYESSNASTSGTRRFLYDGDALVAEYDGSGTLLRRYIHGPGVDEALVWYEGSSLATPRYLHSNHQGSIIALAAADGTLSNINAYDPYGIPQATNVGRFAYTGQIWLPDLGLYYYKARVYSPTLGRFLQTDPIGYDDQINLYAYVGNDPMNGRDPSGLDSCEKALPAGVQGPLATIANCIGDPNGPPTPKDEAERIENEIVVTGQRIKNGPKGSEGREIRDGTTSQSGEVGFKTENGVLTATPLLPKCTKGKTDGYVYPGGFISGSESSIGHTHGAGHDTGLGPHDSFAALQHSSGVSIQADSTGTRGIAKVSTGSAIAISPNGRWGDAGRRGTAQAVMDLAGATKGGSSNAKSATNPCP